jgi:hypothetical protein
MVPDPDGGLMTISFVEPLSRAVERMRRILFQPFDFVKWLVLGFSAWLAGLMGSTGGTGMWNSNDRDFGQPVSVARGAEEIWEGILENILFVPLVLFLLTLVVALILALLWVSSRAKFIFLDNVVHDRAQIVDPWGRFRRLGNSLFLWRFGFFIACALVFGVLAILIMAPAATLSFNDALRGLSFAGMALGVLLVTILAVMIAFVALFLENFVIPIMYKFDLKATEAWSAFLPWLRSRAGWFFLYGLFVLLVAIPACLLFVALVCCTCCIVALPYIGTVILLPVWVAYRVLGPEFLAQFDPSFDIFDVLPPIPVVETVEELEE